MGRMRIKNLWSVRTVDDISVLTIYKQSINQSTQSGLLDSKSTFDGDVAGLCGLTRVDVEAALQKICTSDRETRIKKHISTMTKQFNG